MLRVEIRRARLGHAPRLMHVPVDVESVVDLSFNIVAVRAMRHVEPISRHRLTDFALIGTRLKFGGASGAPIRPIAIPLRHE